MDSGRLRIRRGLSGGHLPGPAMARMDATVPVVSVLGPEYFGSLENGYRSCVPGRSAGNQLSRSGRQAGAGFQAAGHRVSGVPHLPPVNPFPDQGWAVPSDSRLPFSVVAGPAFFGVARSHIDPAEGPSALLAVLGHR